MENAKVRQKFDTAFNLLLEQLKSDKNILAVFVVGSYANGMVWEKSDIDLVLIINDDIPLQDVMVINENNVTINTYLVSRKAYRQSQQAFVHGSMTHHLLATRKLIYSIDRGISETNRDISTVADRDRDIQFLISSEWIIGCLFKAKKTLLVEESLEKCFSWIILAIQQLARIILFLEGKIPGRDVLSQALDETRSEIIHTLIRDVFKAGYTKSNLQLAIDTIEAYLIENKLIFYKLLFEYLQESMGERTHSEIDEYFKKLVKSQNFTLVESINWLTDQGDLMKGSTPKRLTKKSRITVNETTIFFLGGN
jgi:predicted nucleotidyltransferase